jgi:hypothetical protein
MRWLWRVWKRSVGALPQWLQAVLTFLVWVGTPAILLLIALDLAGVLRQPAPPDLLGSDATYGTICPSVEVQDADELLEAAAQIRTIGGWGEMGPHPQIGECLTGPREGTFQVRDMANPTNTHPPTGVCTRRRACVSALRDPKGRVLSAVLYIDGSLDWGTARHELQHIAPGLGHTDSPMSIMYGNDYSDEPESDLPTVTPSKDPNSPAWRLVTKQAVLAAMAEKAAEQDQ